MVANDAIDIGFGVRVQALGVAQLAQFREHVVESRCHAGLRGAGGFARMQDVVHGAHLFAQVLRLTARATETAALRLREVAQAGRQTGNGGLIAG